MTEKHGKRPPDPRVDPPASDPPANKGRLEPLQGRAPRVVSAPARGVLYARPTLSWIARNYEHDCAQARSHARSHAHAHACTLFRAQTRTAHARVHVHTLDTHHTISPRPCRFLVVGGYDNTVRVFALEDGSQLRPVSTQAVQVGRRAVCRCLQGGLHWLSTLPRALGRSCWFLIPAAPASPCMGPVRWGFMQANALGYP